MMWHSIPTVFYPLYFLKCIELQTFSQEWCVQLSHLLVSNKQKQRAAQNLSEKQDKMSASLQAAATLMQPTKIGGVSARNNSCI